jgi:hypothetical protein
MTVVAIIKDVTEWNVSFMAKTNNLVPVPQFKLICDSLPVTRVEGAIIHSFIPMPHRL